MPYIGELRMFAGARAPAGWMFCAGQTLPIAEYEPLFVLIGTTYGGDGAETFNLPDLRARVPVHMGTASSGHTYALGEMAGVESVTLTTAQIPNHGHALVGTTNLASTTAPSGQVVPAVTQASTITAYGSDLPLTGLHPSSLVPQGGSQPHDNLQPHLAINFIISLYGVFPTQT